MKKNYFGEKAQKAKSSERAEAMPAAIITAIVSSLLLLGIATVVSLVIQNKADSEGNVAMTSIASNIDVSLRSDINQASYISASAKLKQPTTRLLTPTDMLLSGVNMHVPTSSGECKVIRWNINGNTASRDLTIYPSSLKTDAAVKCDETTQPVAKRTKVFAQNVDVKAPITFNNQVGRELAFTIEDAALTKVNAVLDAKLKEKNVQKLADSDFNELNTVMGTDSYAVGFKAPSACAMNATPVNGVCPPAEADTVTAAWNSLKIAKVSVAFEMQNESGEITKRDIAQNSSVPLYADAAEAEASVADSSADNRPVSPLLNLSTANVVLGTNYTINWSAGGDCPADMARTYKLYENNVLIKTQSTVGFTKNYTNSATEFLNYNIQTECVRGALVVNSDMSAVAIAKVIPAVPALTINTQPAAVNAALNSNLTSTATCLYGTTPRYNVVQAVATYGTAGTAVSNLTSVNRAINAGFTVVEGARYQYRVEAWCISAYDKSPNTSANTSTFTTLINTPAVPVFTSPLAGAIDIATNATVTWGAVTCPVGTTSQYYSAKDVNAGAAITPAIIDNWTTDLSLASSNTQGNTVGYLVKARCNGTAVASVESGASNITYTTRILTPVATAFSSPAQGATNVATNASVTWNAVVCPTATTTEYYTTKNINANAAIATPTVIDNWTTDVSLVSNNTQGNTVGYTVAVRCAGPNADSASSPTSTLTYTTGINAPVTPLFTAPAEGATNIATNATVTWSAVTCAASTTPQYYSTKNIDKNVAMATPTVIDNWTTDKSLVSSNTEGNTVGYTVAARCVGPNATSGSSATDTVKYTTLINIPAAPAFVSPLQGAMDVPYNATVTWGAITCPTATTTQYYTTKNVNAGVAMATPAIIDNWTVGTTLASNNTQGNTVGYTVAARCAGPNATSGSSATNTVTYTTAINAPAAPAFVSPANGATDVATNATVTWGAVTCAASTTVKYYTTKNIDKNVAMATPTIIDNWTAGNTLATNNTQGNTVGYTVAARCEGPNDISGSSATGSVKYTTAISAPTAPLFTSPAEGATNIATNATVTWSAAVCATGTTVKYYTTKNIDKNVAMATPTIIDNWTVGNTLATNNTQGTTVGYTVAARCDGPNDISASTATDALKYTTIMNAPAMPSFTAPAQGAANIATNATVTWGAVTCATGGTAQYYTTKNMNAGVALATPTVLDNWNTDLSYVSSNTEGNTVGYTVAARCVGPNATSVSSAADTVSYTTLITNPAAPTFVSPVEGATNVATNATVTWSAVTCPASTTVKYYTTKNVDKGVVDTTPTVIDNWTVGTTLASNNTQGNTVGYTVAARCDGPNAVSTGTVSDSVKFTTTISAPSAPLFTSPAEGATNIATNATVSWSVVTCATGTTVQYYTTKNLNAGVIDTTPTVIDNWTAGNTLASNNTQGNKVGYTVAARCSGPNTASASTATDTLTYTTVINTPAMPTFTRPLDGDTDVSPVVTVSWSAAVCGASTTAQYYTTKNVDKGVVDPTPTVIDNWTTGTTLATNNSEGNTVGYTVAARCVGPNVTSGSSATDSMKYTTRVNAPAAPTFTSPAEGDTSIATNATVTWSVATCAAGTTVQYYTTKNMDAGVIDTTPTVIDNWTAGNTLATNNTQGNKVGYTVAARCKGLNDTSPSSATSTLTYITTIAAPSAPTFTAPADNATGIATNATVSWTPVSCATGTTTKYYTTKNVDKGVVDTTPTVIDNWTTDVSYVSSNNQGNTVGYTVKAMCDGPNYNSAQTATDSIKYTTRILAPAMPAFIAPSPADNATKVATNATIAWTDVACATGTTAKFYTTKDRNAGVAITPIVIDSWTTDNSYTTNTLQGHTVRYTATARCDGPNAVSASSPTDYLQYTTTIAAPNGVNTWNDGWSRVDWNAPTVGCAAGTTTEYRVHQILADNAPMDVYGGWQTTGGANLPTYNSGGYPQGANVQTRCTGPNDTSAGVFGNSTKWVKNFSVSFGAWQAWRRINVTASCPFATTVGDFHLYVAADGWWGARGVYGGISTDEGAWIADAQAGGGGNTGWLYMRQTQNQQWDDVINDGTTYNWGYWGGAGWGSTYTPNYNGSTMSGTYWNASGWGSWAYWWTGKCSTPYMDVYAKNGVWNGGGIRNVGDPGAYHNGYPVGSYYTQAGIDATR